MIELRSSRIILILLGFILVPFFAAKADNTTPQDIALLYGFLTKPLPDEFTLTAVVCLEELPWTEDQVQKEVKSQEQAFRETDRLVSPETQKELHLLRTAGIRRAHTGKRWMLWREYRSRGAYRLDSTELWDKAPTAAITNDVEQIQFEERRVNTEKHSKEFLAGINVFTISDVHHTAMASMNAGSRWAETEMWQSISIEPQFALPVVAALMERPDPRVADRLKGINGSFAGLAPDLDKVNIMASGKDPNWTVNKSTSALSGSNGVSFTLREQNAHQEPPSPMHLIPTR